MTSGDLEDLLRARFADPAYALLTQVGISTGFACDRWADALAMGLWPSRGVHLHGFELKVDRGDWLRELKKPEKAERHVRYCDHWWLVVSDKAIVHDGELPKTWGLLVVKGGKLHVAVDAPKLEPEPPPRKFLAAIFRKVVEQKLSDIERQAEYDRGYQAGKKSLDMQYERKRHIALREQVDAFKAASGIDLDYPLGGDAAKVGAAVKAVLGAEESALRTVRYLRDRLTYMLAELNELAPANEKAQ